MSRRATGPSVNNGTLLEHREYLMSGMGLIHGPNVQNRGPKTLAQEMLQSKGTPFWEYGYFGTSDPLWDRPGIPDPGQGPEMPPLPWIGSMGREGIFGDP